MSLQIDVRLTSAPFSPLPPLLPLFVTIFSRRWSSNNIQQRKFYQGRFLFFHLRQTIIWYSGKGDTYWKFSVSPNLSYTITNTCIQTPMQSNFFLHTPTPCQDLSAVYILIWWGDVNRWCFLSHFILHIWSRGTDVPTCMTLILTVWFHCFFLPVCYELPWSPTAAFSFHLLSSLVRSNNNHSGHVENGCVNM